MTQKLEDSQKLEEVQKLEEDQEQDQDPAGIRAQLTGGMPIVQPSTAEKSGSRKFEILAITAGTGNGWEFSADSLRESLQLWDGAQCFVDHAYFGHSVRDLAGVCHSPEFDSDRQGVKLQLRASGPAADILTALAQDMLSEDKKPNVGFSADVVFTAQARKVNKILRVHSVDLVIDPARGGQFLRALNSKEYQTMAEPTVNSTAQPPAAPAAAAQLAEDRQAVRLLLDEQARLQAIQQEAAEARQIRADMCGYLLESALTASRLPAPAQERVRKQFAGQVFESAALQAAIEDARTLVSELTASLVVQGPGRIHGVFSSEDQLQAAVFDMFGAERNPGTEKLQAAKLSGIRELYLMMTGDDDMHGGYHPDRVRLATTADFAGLVKNAMNKVVVNRWAELGRAGYDWWSKIAIVEHFNSLQSITGTLVGTVGSLPAVAEGAEYTELGIGDSPEVATWGKYGGYIPMTLELIDRDDTRKLRAYPNELAAAGLRKISELVAGIFTSNSAVGPTMADGGALFNATAVTTAGGHANLLTTALAAAQWEVVGAAMYNQPLLVKNTGTGAQVGVGPKQGISPKYLLVPRALQLTAKQILYPSIEHTASINSENLQRGEPGDVLTVPEWTDTNDWAAVADPRIAPAIFIGERFGLLPQIFIAGDPNSPAVFTNDESRLKVRHFLSVWVNDYRPLHKENV